MDKERQNLVPPEFITAAEKFIDAAERMDRAWIKMVKTRQVEAYMGLSEERLRGLKRKGKPPEGMEHIAEYLRALEDLLSCNEKS